VCVLVLGYPTANTFTYSLVGFRVNIHIVLVSATRVFVYHSGIDLVTPGNGNWGILIDLHVSD